MAVVVETGSGLNPLANSYVSEADLTAYATARGNVVASATPSALLISAMDDLETRNYKGARVSVSQPLSWPRDGVYVDGVYIEPDAIPQRIKNAQCEAALLIDSGVDLGAATSGGIKRERVEGAIEVEYATSKTTPIYRGMENQLRPLLAGGGAGSVNFAVTR